MLLCVLLCSRRLSALLVFLVVPGCLGRCLCAPVIASLGRARELAFRLGLCLLGFPAVVCAVTRIPSISSLCNTSFGLPMHAQLLPLFVTTSINGGSTRTQTARNTGTRQLAVTQASQTQILPWVVPRTYCGATSVPAACWHAACCRAPLDSVTVHCHGRCSTICCPVYYTCLLYTSPSPRDRTRSRMPSSA